MWAPEGRRGGVRGCEMRGCRRVQGMYNTGGGWGLQVWAYRVVPVGLQGCENAAGKRGCGICGCRDAGLQRGRGANGECRAQGCGDAGMRDAELRSRRDVGTRRCGDAVCSAQRARHRALGARLLNERCGLRDSACTAPSAGSRARGAALPAGLPLSRGQQCPANGRG